MENKGYQDRDPLPRPPIPGAHSSVPPDEGAATRATSKPAQRSLRTRALLLGLAGLLVLALGGGLTRLIRSQAIHPPHTPAFVFTAFALPSAQSQRDLPAMTAGPDGNLWFTESADEGANKIGRMTPQGQLTEFALPSSDSHPVGITAGPGGTLWFTDDAKGSAKIGNITPRGRITEFALPTPRSYPKAITAGPDGNLWFTEVALKPEIGRITPTGQLTEFALPTAFSDPNAIIAGPDGALWFTEEEQEGGDKIGRINIRGQLTEFALPTGGGGPAGITSGPQRTLWFTQASANQIGRFRLST